MRNQLYFEGLERPFHKVGVVGMDHIEYQMKFFKTYHLLSVRINFEERCTR